MIQWNGAYYYSESENDEIRIRRSDTLSGLASATPRTVWSAAGLRLTHVWAPEIHNVDGRWYVYFSADHGGDRRHHLYAIEGGTDPMGSYATAGTGFAEGLLGESSGGWGIDPNVFRGPDDALYLTWSCTASEVGDAPQMLCLAKMKDALHTASATVRISRPDAAWEMRTAAIEEGPVGFLHNGSTYLTYSASASWTTNDYAVGLLENRSGNLLDPAGWVKRGPIFDHHGATYGPGSVVFVPSPDGTEMWNVYHAYDRLNCPNWGCRSIRMQRMRWGADGAPLPDYPVDPYVATPLPSGEGAPGRSLRPGAGTPAWSVAVTVQQTQPVECGVYALYRDDANRVEMFIDAARGVVGTRAAVGGEELGAVTQALPAAFDARAPHALRVERSSSGTFTFYLDGAAMQHRAIALDSGDAGVFGQGAGASFSNFAVTDESFGWGNAQGDAAQGFDRSGGGFVAGVWEIASRESLVSAGGTGTRAIYRNSPAYGDYSVEVEARAADSGRALTPEAGYGLIACHDDRNNEVALWVRPLAQSIQVTSVIHGVRAIQTVGSLPAIDVRTPHRLRAWRKGSVFTFEVDGVVLLQQPFDLPSGTVGLAAAGARVAFQALSL